MSHDSNDLLRQAYEGEVLGEAFFGRLAELADDDERKKKLDVLRRLEASTRAVLRPLVEERGLEVDDEGPARAGSEFAASASALAWPDLMVSLPEGTKQYADLYERMRGAVDDDLVDLLLAHEAALAEFSRREVEGDTERAADAILALPHVR